MEDNKHEETKHSKKYESHSIDDNGGKFHQYFSFINLFLLFYLAILV